MKAKQFKEVNAVYGENQPEYYPLPAYKSEDGTAVFCFELDEEERKKIAETGELWVALRTFNQPLQPICVTVNKSDVFGWNYWATVLIEVKVSRSDFLADAKKSFRQQPEEGVGAFRYYCSPEGLITEVDLPDKWGLLWEKDGVITVVKDAERQQQNAQGEITILASIMRREGVKPRLFDYRKQNNEYEAERRN